MWCLFIFLFWIGFSQCEITDVRLVGGLSKYEGRVEVLFNSPELGESWGTICDDLWTLNAAKVVCHQLGLPEAVAAPTDSYFGRGDENARIWFDRVDCDGSESSLKECYDDDEPTTCNHAEDAGVVCGNPTVTNIQLTNWAGVFTSPGYPNHMERAHYEWTFHPPASYEIAVVCFEYFDIRHRFGATAESNVYVEDANGIKRPFKHESAECVHINPGKVVFKSPLTSPEGERRGFVARYVIIDKALNEHACKDLDISASGGDGRIEVEWKPPKKFSINDYTFIIAYNSTPVVLDIEIMNLTSVLIEYLIPNTKYTVHVLGLPLTEKPGMRWHYCAKEVYTTRSRTRLLGREKSNEGYLEVYDGNQWIDVCTDFMWDLTDVSVACRSMGMKPPVSLPEFFDDDNKKDSKNTKIIGTKDKENVRGLWFLDCRGSDKSLLDCPLLFKWTKPCRNKAPVICVQGLVTQVTISDRSGVITSPGYPHSLKQSRYVWSFSPATPNGRVILYFQEIELRRGFRKGSWSSLTVVDGSDNTLLDIKDDIVRSEKVLVVSGDAKVTFYSSKTFKHNRNVSVKIRYVVVDEPCSKDWEIDLQTKPGMIMAQWSPPKQSLEVRYVVTYNSSSGTSNMLRAVSTSNKIDKVNPNEIYSYGVLAIPKDDKKDMFFCMKDIRVDKATTRLTSGNAQFEGIVEVFFNNRWGTICADMWTLTEAVVVCRSLGLPDATFALELWVSLTHEKILSGVTCSGKESSITECQHTKMVKWSRCYDYNAAVVCGKPQ